MGYVPWGTPNFQGIWSKQYARVRTDIGCRKYVVSQSAQAIDSQKHPVVSSPQSINLLKVLSTVGYLGYPPPEYRVPHRGN